jgi:hypothetical protein
MAFKSKSKPNRIYYVAVAYGFLCIDVDGRTYVSINVRNAYPFHTFAQADTSAKAYVDDMMDKHLQYFAILQVAQS